MRGILRIGISFYESEHPEFSLAEVIRRCKEANPEISYDVRVADETTLYALLRNGDIDCAFVVPIDDFTELTVHKVSEVNIYLYCGKHHPLYSSEESDLTNIAKHETVYYQISGSNIAAIYHEILPGVKFGFSTSLHDGVVLALDSGKFTAFCPEYCMQAAENNGDVRKVAPEQIRATFPYCLVYNQSKMSLPTLKAFIKEIEHCQNC